MQVLGALYGQLVASTVEYMETCSSCTYHLPAESDCCNADTCTPTELSFNPVVPAQIHQ